MILNYGNPYNPTGQEKLASDIAPQTFSTFSRLLGYPYLLGIDDHYLPVASSVGRNPEGKRHRPFAHFRRGFDIAPYPKTDIKTGMSKPRQRRVDR